MRTEVQFTRTIVSGYSFKHASGRFSFIAAVQTNTLTTSCPVLTFDFMLYFTFTSLLACSLVSFFTLMLTISFFLSLSQLELTLKPPACPETCAL